MDCRSLVRAYVLNKDLEDDVNDDMLKIIKSQTLLPLLFITTSNIKYKNYYISACITNERFNNVINNIKNVFNEYNIPYFFMKGTELKGMYPNPEVRTMGDIDVFIKYSDLSRASKALENNGFKSEADDSEHNVVFYYDNIEIELHFAMLDDADDKIGFFKNPFDKAILVDKSYYKLDNTFHLAFLITHFARHLLFGAGIRYMMDFYYMMKNNDIDYTRLHSYMKTLKLEVLYNNILNVLDYLFDTKFDEYIKVDIMYFIDYMEKYGIHGYHNNDLNITQVKKHRFSHFMSKVFLLNKGYRLSKFSKVGNIIILWPILVVINIIRLVFTKFHKFLILIFKRSNRKKLYKKLGI